MPEIEPAPQRAYASVHLILENDKKEILLFHRIDNSAWHGLYVPVAGKVDKHEDVYSAMCREAYEEAGLKLTPQDLQLVFSNQRLKQPYADELVDVFEFYFLCRVTNQTPRICEPNIAELMSFYPLNNLPKKTSPYIKLALDNIQKNIHFAVIPEPLI